VGIFKREKTWYIDYYDQYGRRHRERIGPNKQLIERYPACQPFKKFFGEILHLGKKFYIL